MRVAVYRSNDDLRIEERQRPVASAGEVLLRVEASGICGSDTMEWYRRPKAPLVLGHEVAGVVEESGAPSGFAIGDRVVATHHVPCGRCRYCLTDRESACDTLHRTTFDPGGFAEFVRVPALHVERGGVLRLPDGVSFEDGSFVEPLACAVRAQRLAGMPPGASVAVLGAGVSGLLHAQLAKANGAGFVVATDVSPARLAAARALGADAAILADHEAEVAAALRGANEGRLAERVFVCTGARPAFEQALRLVDRGGVIVFFAPLSPEKPWPCPSPICGGSG